MAERYPRYCKGTAPEAPHLIASVEDEFLDHKSGKRQLVCRKCRNYGTAKRMARRRAEDPELYARTLNNNNAWRRRQAERKQGNKWQD